MPGRVLNTNLAKIKVDLKKNFEFMKTRLLSFRLLLLRQFLSLKLKLTFKSNTQMNIQDLICSRGGWRLLREMTDCPMLWVDLCETIPFWSLKDDCTYSSSIIFILRNIIRFLPRVSYSRLRKDPLVLPYCLKLIVHTYNQTIVQEILLYFTLGYIFSQCQFYEFLQTLASQIFSIFQFLPFQRISFRFEIHCIIDR